MSGDRVRGHIWFVLALAALTLADVVAFMLGFSWAAVFHHGARELNVTRDGAFWIAYGSAAALVVTAILCPLVAWLCRRWRRRWRLTLAAFPIAHAAVWWVLFFRA